MDLHVTGGGPAEPFLGAADVFATEFDLDLPVEVAVRDDPDERTFAAHYDDRHVLNVSRQVAGSAMARELALHEFGHMARHEEDHPSHVQSTDEALFLALSGRSVERRKLAHCYQIANHMKDIYADDITLSLSAPDKLVDFLESRLAAAVAGNAAGGAPEVAAPDGWELASSAGDPEITAVNAAFALALIERHELAPADHRIYDLARAAGNDAPAVDVAAFKRRFRSLSTDPDESEYRKALVDAARAYAVGDDRGRAAD